MSKARLTQIVRIREYISERLRNKPAIRPYFIIKFGPPASGKTTVMKHVYQRVLGIDPQSVVDVDVDEMVLELTDMQGALRGLLAEHSVEHSAAELGDNVQQLATSIYFQQRGYVDDLADKLMMDAIMDHKHVSVETIGKSPDKWRSLLGKIRAHGYITVLIYPYVASSTLKDRLLQRNKQQLRKLTWAQVSPIVTAAQNTFVELVPLVDMALMLDNTGKDLHTVVDVVNNESKCQLQCAVLRDVSMADSLKTLIRGMCQQCKSAASSRSSSRSSSKPSSRKPLSVNRRTAGVGFIGFTRNPISVRFASK